MPWERLRDKLLTLEGKPYQAYASLQGEYRFERYVLFLDSVAQDPAMPSLMRVRIDQAEARFPQDLSSTRVRRVALEDFIARRWHEVIRKVIRTQRGGRAAFGIEGGGQQILERSACRIAEDWIEIRGTITWPSDGRKAAPKLAQAVVTEDLPQLVDGALISANQNPSAVSRHVHLAEDVEALRQQLQERSLVAFIADGAVLPRELTSDKPLLSHLVTLRALAWGVYTHLPGDGREFCGTVADAVVVTADEGRRIEGVNLQPFITALPTGEDVTQYRAEHASLIISQSAALAETLEAGCSALLIDEDTSAPGLLAQDPLLRRLATGASGPVVPLVDLLRPLYEEHGISAVVVTSASSDYARIADTVIVMNGFHASVVTAQAKEAIVESGSSEARHRFGGIHHRVPLPESVNQLRGRRLRPEMQGPRSVLLGRDAIDLTRLPQLVDSCQGRAAGAAIVYAAEQGYVDGSRTVREILAVVDTDMAQKGLDVLVPLEAPGGDLARPRRQEIAAALNRLRTLRVKP
ncbi:MAG: hypothetical protein HYU43_00725 [Armatimonadetes bacterium]|nr:hypothetical protein [Armatimonadota bacterium]